MTRKARAQPSREPLYVLFFTQPTPTNEERIRDCPRLQSQLYHRFRLSRDPDERINVAVQLSGPEGELVAAHNLKVYARHPALVAASAPVSSLCVLSNARQVWHVLYDTPGIPS